MPINDIHNERELLVRIAKDDENAFAEIYHHYYKGLLLWSNNILKDKEACEDLIQDVFLSIWTKRASLTITTSLEAYLYTAVRYQVLTTIRKGKVRTSVFENLEQKIWGDVSPDNLLYQKELQARLTHIIRELPEKAQEVYRLSREEQLSNKEIAAQLNISLKTVEFHISVALRKIRNSFSDLLPLIIFFIGRK